MATEDGNGGQGPPRAAFKRTILDIETQTLSRFPAVFSLMAEIPKHQLGWRMAILPFRVSGTPSGYAIAFGMAEEMSAAISRFRSPRLIAPVTFWDGTGPAADALGRCRMYDLDYMLDGTIEIIGDAVRMTVVLLDVVLDFEVIWTGNFKSTMSDLVSLQSQIAGEVVKQLDPDLFVRGPMSDAPVSTSVPRAHHLVLLAIRDINRLDRTAFMGAHSALAEAIALDPGYASAYAWLAFWSFLSVGSGWADDPAHVMQLGREAADRAIELDPSDARALAVAGHVKAYLQHDVTQALELHRRAVELNPNLPIAWALSSASKSYSGQHLSAIRHATMARELSPRDPHMFLIEHILTVAHFLHHDLDAARTLSDVVLARHPDHMSAINLHLGILGHLGKQTEAKHWLAELMKLNPAVSIQSIVARVPLRPADREYYAVGLRLSCVPD